MITVFGTFRVYSGCEKDALRILYHHVKQMHTDPNLLVSKVYRSRREPQYFCVLEEFPDWETFVAHRSTREYGKYIVTELYSIMDPETFSIDTYDLIISSESQET
jgi:quinol monooxygenase YgiN